VSRAFPIPEAPRSWKEWSARALSLTAIAGGLAIVASGPGHQLPAFWVLWGVMVAALAGLLLHRASALARHATGDSTTLDRALWIAAETAGFLAVLALLVTTLS
jgi:hypothetical protein